MDSGLKVVLGKMKLSKLKTSLPKERKKAARRGTLFQSSLLSKPTIPHNRQHERNQEYKGSQKAIRRFSAWLQDTLEAVRNINCSERTHAI